MQHLFVELIFHFPSRPANKYLFDCNFAIYIFCFVMVMGDVLGIVP